MKKKLTNVQARRVALLFLTAMAHNAEVEIANEDNLLSEEERDRVQAALSHEVTKLLRRTTFHSVPITFAECVLYVAPERKPNG
jgi:hypothetical protein